VITLARLGDQIVPLNGDRLSAHGGIGGVFGIAHRDGFFFEFKVAGGGGPSVRLGIGYMIRAHH
jgi:hypothetical protein